MFISVVFWILWDMKKEYDRNAEERKEKRREKDERLGRIKLNLKEMRLIEKVVSQKTILPTSQGKIKSSHNFNPETVKIINKNIYCKFTKTLIKFKWSVGMVLQNQSFGSFYYYLRFRLNACCPIHEDEMLKDFDFTGYIEDNDFNIKNRKVPYKVEKHSDESWLALKKYYEDVIEEEKNTRITECGGCGNTLNNKDMFCLECGIKI